MDKITNILLVGVGGQGTILASKILSEGLMIIGHDVKMSEVHGMAQRGGSVSTQVRFGKKVYSPLIEKGKADIIVAFEKLESIRWIPYLEKEGYLVVNDYEIYPVPVLIGKDKYPDNIADEIKKNIPHSLFVDANGIAKQLGNEKAQNIVLLGTLIKSLKLDSFDWKKIISENVPQKALELNYKAYEAGLGLVK